MCCGGVGDACVGTRALAALEAAGSLNADIDPDMVHWSRLEASDGASLLPAGWDPLGPVSDGGPLPRNAVRGIDVAIHHQAGACGPGSSSRYLLECGCWDGVCACPRPPGYWTTLEGRSCRVRRLLENPDGSDGDESDDDYY